MLFREANVSNRWTVQLVTYLFGIAFTEWWTLLKENRFHVHPRYLLRAALITGMSVFNSLVGSREDRKYGAQITACQMESPPIFIIGHWGSGTTHLHTLLTRDRRFAYPTLFDVANPHTMLTAEQLLRRCVERFTPQRRVWDNVAVSLDMPAEDEFATSLLCGLSPYLAWSFPEREPFYDRFLTFDGVSIDELAEWKATVVYFMKQLTYKYRRGLVLKSPPHTARIRLLLEMFPGARFVHIHRDPFDVFHATRRLYEKALPYFYLQRPDPSRIEAGIIQRYAVMYRAFFEQRTLIPVKQLHEVSYEALQQDPQREMETLYEALGLPEFDHARDDLQRYLDSIADYQKNRNPPLPASMRESIAQAWSRSFDEWGYPSDSVESIV